MDVREGLDAGTPVIRAEEVPCYLCMKCPEVCPSGALRPVEPEATRMGLAVIDKETCVAWNDTSLCRTCYNVCPLQDLAIELPEMRPEVVDDSCVGCGVCVHACPIPTGDGRKAINVEPAR